MGDAREEIDALNVYPVPDGDTGTNMYLTTRGRGRAAVDARRAGETSRRRDRGSAAGAPCSVPVATPG